jgi:hypothetical protein
MLGVVLDRCHSARLCAAPAISTLQYDPDGFHGNSDVYRHSSMGPHDERAGTTATTTPKQGPREPVKQAREHEGSQAEHGEDTGGPVGPVLVVVAMVIDPEGALEGS